MDSVATGQLVLVGMLLGALLSASRVMQARGRGLDALAVWWRG